MKAQMDRETKERGVDVNNMLREKVQETMGLKNQLEKAISELMNEMANLAHTKTLVKKVLHDKEIPLRIAGKRAGVRRSRPMRESINDTVERTLQLELGDLKGTVAQLNTGVQTAEEHLEKMERLKRQLMADLADKTDSVRLDQDCLNVRYGGVGQDGKAAAVSQVASALNIQPKRSGVVPEQWRAGTRKLLETAGELCKMSQQVVKSLKKLMRNVENSNAKAAHDVNAALRQKVKQTTQLHANLSQKLQDVNQEILALQEQRQQITQALQAKEAPLNVLKQRLSIRRQRPTRECVRDKVEEAMEAELAKVSQAVMELDRKLKNIDQELNELRDDKRQIEQDIHDKTEALRLDKQCIEIDMDNMSVMSGASGMSGRSDVSYGSNSPRRQRRGRDKRRQQAYDDGGY
eukprot:TRINITY_DN69400_c0_g1_i1.p1 TRINITY_DN69400_c0_g1~~TRINITY_DN69400_c0_g1_i1.p1  ORF type:complete len:474 (-),score=63.07 TRINITY_DN69400_c0_g1_i1:422-1639(-)